MYRDPIGHRIKTLNNLMRKTMDKQTGRPDRATLMHLLDLLVLLKKESI